MWNWLTSLFRRPQTAARLGDRGENVAATYLESQGFRILERQHRGHYGEVDLIAIDRDTIVFVEVKTRATIAAGDPTEAVNRENHEVSSRVSEAKGLARAACSVRCRGDPLGRWWRTTDA
jgi:putative endonuclease